MPHSSNSTSLISTISQSSSAKSPYFYKLFNQRKENNNTKFVPPQLFIDKTNGLLDDLTVAETNILSYGLKYVVAPENVDLREEIAQIGIFANRLKKTLKHTGEEAVDNHNKKRVNDFINNCTDQILEQHLENSKIKQNLSAEEKKALINLKSRSNIVFKKADKSPQLVAMREDEYIRQIEEMLSDTSVYKQVDNDPTDDLLLTLEAFLENAVIKSQITEHQKKELHPAKPKPGVFDGLPKTHKPGCPIRPIVSQVNTVTRKLSEYVDKVLQPYVTKMETYNKDTIDMINVIEGTNKTKELSKHATILLLTMDIDSFYTNVTCEMAIKSITTILEQNKHSHSEISFITDCLRLIFDSNNFTFNGHHYIQVCGMSMGSPCAPSVCSLTFYVYETKFIGQHPKFLKWKRHIDDIFSIFAGTKRQLQILINKFVKNSDFNFTSDISVKSVNFLDITITLEKDKTLSTNVYRHPAKVPVYTHNQSCQSDNVKKSIIKSSCLRFRRICSSLNNYDKACKELQNNLVHRGHQLQQIQHTIKEVRNIERETLLARKPKDISPSNYVPRLSLTYIPGTIRIISDIMKKLEIFDLHYEL